MRKINMQSTSHAIKRSEGKSTPSPITILKRKPHNLIRLLLFVRAGGRCEFDGCNEYLLRHHLTLTEGNFAEMAHIVAFKPDGPRGKSSPGRAARRDRQSRGLLGPPCHKLIDNNPS